MSGSILFHGNGRLVRGEETSVKIVVDFAQPTKVRGIHATFHAAERTEANYTVSTTDHKGKVKTETKTAVEYSNIVDESFLLMGEERRGCLGRLLDSLKTWGGGGQHVKMEPGHQEFPVTLRIPENAPASFAGKKCEVFYRLNVQVDVPIKVDMAESRQFEVLPVPVPYAETKPVHVVFPDGSSRSFWDRSFGKDVNLNLAIDRDTLTVGEKALAMLTVETPEPLKLDEITVGLSGTESTEAEGHTDSYHHWHELQDIDSPNVLSNESVYEFDIQIPKIEGPFTQSGVNFQIDWFVEVRLKVPWAKDPVIRVPIKLLPKKT